MRRFNIYKMNGQFMPADDTEISFTSRKEAGKYIYTLIKCKERKNYIILEIDRVADYKVYNTVEEYIKDNPKEEKKRLEVMIDDVTCDVNLFFAIKLEYGYKIDIRYNLGLKDIDKIIEAYKLTLKHAGDEKIKTYKKTNKSLTCFVDKLDAINEEGVRVTLTFKQFIALRKIKLAKQKEVREIIEEYNSSKNVSQIDDENENF